jgi:hypothetical protein
MISEENLIQLSSVRDRWITEIRSANITTDANPGTTIPQPPDCCRSRSHSCTALEARLRSSQWIGDGGRPVALKRQVAGARGVSLHKARGPAIEDRFFLGN